MLHFFMIKSFKSKALRKAFETGDTRNIRHDLIDRVFLVLDALHDANKIESLFLQTFRTHRLGGDRKGVWTMMVNKNWRITFKFEDGHAYDVDLEDYH